MDALEQIKNSMLRLVSQGQQWIHRVPPKRRLYASIGVLSVTTVFILTGLSGSGKTALFYQLRDGSSHPGIPISMSPNEGTFVLHSETIKEDLLTSSIASYFDPTRKGRLQHVHLVDVPQNSSLRPKLDVYLLQAAGLIFVVDALIFLPNCHGAAEFLYDILTSASVVKRKIPVLVLCNKTDKVTAHTKRFIRKQLERKIEKMSALITAPAADIADDYVLGETFTFSQCNNEMTIAEASALTGMISQVEKFIREHVTP